MSADYTKNKLKGTSCTSNRHADHNSIKNMTEFGTEAFPDNQYFLHAQKFAKFVPFSATPAVKILYV